MHGEKDTIVPFSMGVEIYENANSPKSKYFIKYDDHMMNFDQNDAKLVKFSTKTPIFLKERQFLERGKNRCARAPGRRLAGLGGVGRGGAHR